jgi:urease accessory protein
VSLWGDAELAPYSDDAGSGRDVAATQQGRLEMEFARQGERSVLAHLHREAPLVAQQALYWDEHLPGMPCVFMITTAGCVLQGDRLDLSIKVRSGAMAHVTTQAATKIHQMNEGYAAQSQHLAVEDDAYLELLPGPVIPHRRSRFVTRTRAIVASSATLLATELLQPGRMHHGDGEIFEYDLYSSAFTAARPGSAPLFTERFVCEPRRHPVRSAGAMADFNVLATVILVTPPATADVVLERAEAGTNAATGCMAGASRLPNAAGLIYKVLGRETEPVKGNVREFWKLARRAVLGVPIPQPRSWE